MVIDVEKKQFTAIHDKLVAQSDKMPIVRSVEQSGSFAKLSCLTV